MRPVVSVIMPTYNGEAYVAEALESIFAQTWRPLEVLVCDDGSSDRTVAILHAFGDRIRLLTQPNAGVAAARNRAIAAASGSFLAFLDQDDLWEPQMLEVQVRTLLERADLGMVYADSWIVDEGGTRHGRRAEFLRYAEGWIFSKLLRGNFIPIETTVMPTAVFHEVGGFNPELRYLEDYELCLRVARRHPVGFHAEPLASYRIHGKNLSYQREAILAEWTRILESLVSRFKDLSLTERKVIWRERDNRCGELAWQALRRGDVEAADAWLSRDDIRCAAPLAFKIKVLRSLSSALPKPLLDRLLRLLPKHDLYGVPVKK